MKKRFPGPRTTAALIFAAAFLAFFAAWGTAQRVVAVPNEAYENLKIFTDVFGIVQQDYAEPVDSKKLIYGAVKGMVRDLDPHSSFMTPEEYGEMQVDTKGVFGGIGIEIGLKDNTLTVVAPIEDTPAHKAGLLAGDRIVKINDTFTKDMALTDAVNMMRGPKDTAVTIHIMREGFDSPKAFTLVRAIIKVKSIKQKMLDEGFGYVRITQFQENTGSDLEKALKEITPKDGKLKGLILDLRNNPGGLLQEAVSVSNLFLNVGTIVSTKGRKQGQDMIFNADSAKTQPDYPMIVIVNMGSASASEIVAGALQDHKRAVILGTTTFGKGSVQTIIPLTDGSAIRLTTAKYFTPSGRSIQAKGIEPDIVVGETVKGFLKEKDLAGHLPPTDSIHEGIEKKEDKKDALDKRKVVEQKAKGEEGEDVQLKRAVDYLKSWQIFKTTMQKAG
ncbi:MAG: S41 family peptidase [Deltaproteobacteria bacterium]|nr:S41 family peptidase [Deltaproteobacteria bacterium]